MKDRRTRIGTLSIALRPLRLAFMVAPSDREGVLKAIQVNTILWGGLFNPIVFAFKRSPHSYAEGRFRPRASDIVAGYLSAYDPDFIVLVDTDLPRGVQFDTERIISPDAILSGLEEEEAVGYGVGLNELMAHLYAEEFKFACRHPVKVTLPEPANTQDRLLVAACFGDMLTGTRVDFRRLWADLLEGQAEPVKPVNVYKLLDRGVVFPLRLGTYGIDVLPREPGWHEPAFFWMDRDLLEDVVDYWNLRATGYNVLPLPLQWAEELRGAVLEQVERNHVADKFNKSLMHGTTFIKSRHTLEKDLSSFIASLKLPANQHMASLQRWVPRIHDEWRRSAGHWDDWDPCCLAAEERKIRLDDFGERLTFETLAPAHAERYVWGARTRYANVVKLRVYGAEDEVAAVIPPHLQVGHSLRPFGALPRDFRVARDGPTILCAHADRTFDLPVPLPWHVFSAWLKASKCSARISDAGRIAQAMLECLGGLHGIRLLQGWWIIDFLERVASGASVSVGEASQRLSPPAGEVSGESMFRVMVEKDILEVGVEIQCVYCGRRSWFALDEVKEELRCSVCTRRFAFPASTPPPHPWRYRAVGPFSLPNYANGCYTVLLAMYFLVRTLDASATVVPSFDLTFPDGSASEVDFAMLWRESQFRDDTAVYPLFGECVSLNAFVDSGSGKNDVAKMRKMARTFPGAVLVFATLAEALQPRDKRAIRALAIGGRNHWKGDRWLNPVLVLTRRELMSFWKPPKCWEDVSGPVGDFAKKQYHFTLGMLDLCDLTQQLYLDLPPRLRVARTALESKS